ncbi:MAG: type II secretion system F family protein [bacterium]|nr:type II secretion system F family protein [bacterium]
MMARFAYVARDAGGQSRQGELVAGSEPEAARLLRGEGKFVVTLTEVAEALDPGQIEISLGRRRVTREEVIHFASQLAIMVETGVPITEAISGMMEQSAPGAFRRILGRVLADIETGKELSVALAKHPRAFTPLFVNLVRASEASGTLGGMLNRCAVYLSEERDTRRRVRGAMIYPALVMAGCIGVTIFMLTYMLPKFTGIYAGKEALLPAPTRILMAFSGWLTDWWTVWVSVLVAVLVGSWFFFHSNRGRPPKHWLAMRLPIVGPMVHKTLLTRCLRTLGTLVDSGVSMLESVAITRSVVGNHFFEQLWDRVAERLHRGDQLSAPLAGDPLVPRAIVQMIHAGERSGQLGAVMGKVGRYLEEDLRVSIKTATQMIEPIMILVMGTIVGSIAISLLLPIFTISRVIAR